MGGTVQENDVPLLAPDLPQSLPRRGVAFHRYVVLVLFRRKGRRLARRTSAGRVLLPSSLIVGNFRLIRVFIYSSHVCKVVWLNVSMRFIFNLL